MSGKDVKPATVEKVAELIKKSNPNLSSEQARNMARREAERANQDRRKGR